jgi:hypothetical protein
MPSPRAGVSGLPVPSVTALVCAYDYERYVAEAIESVLAQDYAGDVEVLVVDDGSTDGTPEVLRGFGDAIRVVRQENAGLNAATARGIAEARGDLIALLDADDAWRPDKLRRQVDLLMARPEIGLVYSDKEIVDGAGRRVHPSFFAHHGIAPVAGHAVGPLLRHNVVPAPTIIFRRSLAAHVLPFPAEVAAQDWWLAVRIAAVAELACVPEPLTRYRVHGANMGVGNDGDEHFARLVRRDNAFRRWMLRHLDLSAATAAELADAWQTFAKAVAFVAQELGVPAAEQLAVGDADRAEARRLRALSATAPDRPAAARLLVAACAADPLDGAATAALAELLTAPDPEARVDWAEERFGAGDVDAALDALMEVAAAGPPPGLRARVHADIAVIAHSLGALPAARDAAAAALAHDPGHASALEVIAACEAAERGPSAPSVPIATGVLKDGAERARTGS